MFSVHSFCRQVYLSLELRKEKMLPAPARRVVRITYRPGSKAFTTHVRTCTCSFWTPANIFTASNHPDEGTKKVNRNGVCEVFPELLLSSVLTREAAGLGGENPEASGQTSGNLICFFYAALAWPCFGEASCSEAEPPLGGLLPGVRFQQKPRSLLLEARAGWEFFK